MNGDISFNEASWPIDSLGSGSDYAPFLDYLGVAALNLAYGGEGGAGAGIYHSAYDDFYWYTHFDDTTFVYGRALAQTAGTAVMRLADADLLPMNFGNYRRWRFADISGISSGWRKRKASRSASAIRRLRTVYLRRRPIRQQTDCAAATRSPAAASELCAAGKRGRPAGSQRHRLPARALDEASRKRRRKDERGPPSARSTKSCMQSERA